MRPKTGQSLPPSLPLPFSSRSAVSHRSPLTSLLIHSAVSTRVSTRRSPAASLVTSPTGPSSLHLDSMEGAHGGLFAITYFASLHFTSYERQSYLLIYLWFQRQCMVDKENLVAAEPGNRLAFTLHYWNSIVLPQLLQPLY